VVTALGNASYLWAAMHHTPENFYVEDSMGFALPHWRSALRSRNRSASASVVVEGDGAILMHMGALVTVGAVKPDNLTVLLIQNGVHAASGGQALTNPSLDLAQLARSAGIAALHRTSRRRTPCAAALGWLPPSRRPASPRAVDRTRSSTSSARRSPSIRYRPNTAS
jgi:thiamine pyrophosphate-dependent acetolactate synthase large subunit-like protein